MIESLIRYTILLLYRTIAPTWRIVEEGLHEKEEVGSILNGNEPASILFAHGKMLPLWYHFRSSGGVPVTSMSRDGERLSWVLTKGFGFDRIIRGSSSSGGSGVLVELVDTLTSRSTLVTPDGPRGPRNEAKAGGVVAAARSGRRILVATWRADLSIRLGSWDRMEIPIPFSRVYIRYCTMSVPTTESISVSIASVSRFLSASDSTGP